MRLENLTFSLKYGRPRATYHLRPSATGNPNNSDLRTIPPFEDSPPRQLFMHTVITLSADSLFFQAFYHPFEIDWVEIKHNALALANNIQQGGGGSSPLNFFLLYPRNPARKEAFLTEISPAKKVISFFKIHFQTFFLSLFILNFYS